MNEIARSATRRTQLQREQRMKFGTEITSSGVRFRLWAPKSGAVAVAFGSNHPSVAMTALPRGWFEVEVDGIKAGDSYQFELADGTRVPDPASRHQPGGVDGPSEVIDPRAFSWTDIGWRGRPWEEAILYELHIGTFTAEGTFHAAARKLDHLVDLGVTAIELMPIADFKGRWNWGYDGVLQFAPACAYGRPEELKALVDAAHARQLMVIVDVVYNHFGPEGNFLDFFSPLRTDRHTTAWGAALNFDDAGAGMIRDFVTVNALYWLNEFHADGLRLDAVHAIKDEGPKHLLQELAEKARAATDGRYIHLIVENAANQANWLKRKWDGTPWLYTAQWSDDIHHALHWLATGEANSYYADYAGQPHLLGRALAEGLSYQGERTATGAKKGEPVGDIPTTSFVSFIQNHDQVGNRPYGERLSRLASPRAINALAAIYLLAPPIPLLFMGEEWGSVRPFLYFIDASEDLAEKIRVGRRSEFNEVPSGALPGGNPPDPFSEETFLASKLDWTELDSPANADRLRLYRKLIAIRHVEIIPRLQGMYNRTGRYELLAERALKVEWDLGDGSILQLLANLDESPLDGVDIWGQHHLWLEGYTEGRRLDPWGVLWTLRDPVG